MDVLIVRHADAGERDPRQWPDDDKRPLSKKGARDFRKVARKLGTLVPHVDAVWSSSLVRAWQTAELLAEEAPWPAPQPFDHLEPGGRLPFVVELLRHAASSDCVVLVGHEPDLGELIGLLVGGEGGQPLVDLKKGAAALLRFDGRPDTGKGVLAWLLPPRVIVGG